MPLRQDDEIPLLRDERVRNRSPWVSPKVSVAPQEAIYLQLVLLLLQRAGRVHQQSSGRHQLAEGLEQRTLEPLQSVQCLRGHPPSGIGVTRERSRRQAGSVQQNGVDRA